MSTQKFRQEGRKEGLNFLELDFDFYENPDTIQDHDFCGKELDRPLYCVLHDTKPLRCVAFEGSDMGRRFYSCAVKRGVNCGVVEWVDRPWPVIMQRCLLKLWGKLQAKDEEINRLKMDIKQVNLKLENLVAAVEGSNVTTMKIDRQKKQMGIIDKDVKRIQRSLTSAIHNLKDDKGDIKMDRDFLKEELHKLKENRSKMQSAICDLLGKGFANADDLLMMKAILKE
ncbi:hypothetical protein VPH35_032609 [Triticum aestivum]